MDSNGFLWISIDSCRFIDASLGVVVRQRQMLRFAIQDSSTSLMLLLVARCLQSACHLDPLGIYFRVS
jgi:hypothetical protein